MARTASLGYALLRAFLDEQRLLRRIEHRKAQDRDFRTDYEDRTAALVSNGHPTAFTHRLVIRAWSSDLEAPDLVRDAASMADHANRVIEQATESTWPGRTMVGGGAAFAAAGLLATRTTTMNCEPPGYPRFERQR